MSDDSQQSSKELKYDVPSWLQELLELAQDCGQAMFETEAVQKDPDLFHQKDNRELKFKAQLRQLYFWYKPKFSYVDDSVASLDGIDSDLEQAEDVWALDFDEAKTLFRQVRDLMEALGHTRFEGDMHSDKGY